MPVLCCRAWLDSYALQAKLRLESGAFIAFSESSKRMQKAAARCTVRFGAKGLMSTLMRVRISSDAPRCTVQFGALDPRCTMVQVHGDPNEPSLGAGAAVAPCVTLRCGVTAPIAAG